MAAAGAGARRSPRSSHQPVSSRPTDSSTSSPTHASRQCCAAYVSGRVAAKIPSHGSNPAPASAGTQPLFMTSPFVPARLANCRDFLQTFSAMVLCTTLSGMAEPPEQRVLTGPDLKALQKALANPVRRDILGYLGKHGEANSTSVAKALGESTGTTSYHLRKLAEQKLIAEIEERSAGRERWWRSMMTNIYTPPGLELTDDERTAATQIGALKMSHDLDLVVRAYAGYDSSEGWNQIYRAGLTLTKDQVEAFATDFRALLWKYTTEAEPGARDMAIRLVVLPEDNLTNPTPATSD